MKKVVFLFQSLVILILLYLMTFSVVLHRSRAYKQFSRLGCRSAIRFFNIKVTKIIAAKTLLPDSYIMVSNHVSVLDAVFLMCYFDVIIVGMAHLRLPLLNRIMQARHIQVDRDSLASRINCSEEIISRLKNGENILIFPEGTTNRYLSNQFSDTIFQIALLMNTPIVPVFLDFESLDDFAFLEPWDFSIAFKKILTTQKNGVDVYVFDAVLPSLYQDKLSYCQAVYHFIQSQQEKKYRNNEVKIMNDFHAKLTIVDILQNRAKHQPSRIAFSFQTENKTEKLTYSELDRAACACAVMIRRHAKIGDRVMVSHHPGFNFIIAFFGCLYANVIAVPAHPPLSNKTKEKFYAIKDDAAPSLIIGEAKDLHKLALDQPIFDMSALNLQEADAWQAETRQGDTIAFLQYTSGSTGNPKGVIVTHQNLMANLRQIQRYFGHTESSRGVIWLPPYHDMGLIGGILEPVHTGFPGHLFAPLAFIRQPYSWLKAISDWKATTSGAPSFAYEMCVKNITEEQKKNLDLSHWQVAFNGAEPINLEAYEKFADYFQSCGFKRHARFPCYGLAESTLYVAGQQKNQPITLMSVDKIALQQHHLLFVPEHMPNSKKIISCGKIAEEIDVLIVDLVNHHSTTDIGEIVIAGSSVTQGYYKKENLNADLFVELNIQGKSKCYLRTGDLGFIRKGELFVTGRLKDLIIHHGTNHYPQDIELTVEQCHPAMMLNGTAAFTKWNDEQTKLVIVSEVKNKIASEQEYNAICDQIIQAVGASHQLPVSDIFLISSRKLPKTTSGKVQRNACRELIRQANLPYKFHWQKSGEITNKSPTTPDENDVFFTHPFWNWLCEWLKKEMGVTLQKTDMDKHISYYGIDSIQLIRFAQDLSDYVGAAVDPIKIWEYTTLRDLFSLAEAVSLPSAVKVNANPGLHMANHKKKALELSLFYFSSEDKASTENYRLLKEGALFADKNDFTAIWTPERHFHRFGGLFPNPSVTSAYLAAITQSIRLRAGSVILPLHHPIRVAEDFALVDQLSNGRVDLGFGQGWNPDDFVLNPEKYTHRLSSLYEGIDTIMKLWRGEAIESVNGENKKISVKLYPRPIQNELNVWLTCSGSLDRFIQAGEKGFNIITALLFQELPDLGKKIKAYRDALQKNGWDPNSKKVTLMMHTFIGNDMRAVKAYVREPFIEYLKSSVSLWSNKHDSFHNMKKTDEQSFFQNAFERYFNQSALIGTPQTVRSMLADLSEIGVDEIACLIDFGVDTDITLQSLPYLAELKEVKKAVPIPIYQEQKLSLNQQYLWAYHMLNPGETLYNVGIAMCFQGELDGDLLHQSCDILLQRNEILRMQYASVSDQSIAKVHSTAVLLWKTVDFSMEHFASFKNKAIDYFRKELALSFDFESDPLIRHLLLKFNANHHVLLIITHHMVFDGWSWDVYLKELQNSYNMQINDRDNGGLALKTYHDFVNHQHKIDQKRLLDFWKDNLVDLPTLNLPTDKIRGNAAPIIEHYAFDIESTVLESLSQLGKEHKVTLFTILFTAFCVLIHRYSQQDDFAIGVPFHGRESGEYKNVIGFFANTLPIRIQITPDITGMALFDKIQQTIRDASQYQAVSLLQLASEIKLSRHVHQNTFFQAMFSFNLFQSKFQFHDLQAQLIDFEGGSMPCDIAFDIHNYFGNMQVILKYDGSLYVVETIRRMATHWLEILRGLIRDPNQSISQISLLTPHEKELMLINWNATQKIYPADSTLTGLFEQQVKITPNLPAVIDKNQMLSYQDLNSKSNQFAYYLKNQGIKSGDLVAVCLDPSINLVVSLLGILKIGAAYVPLDPAYPSSRLHYMLSNSQSSCLVTDNKYAVLFADTNAKIFFMQDVQNQLNNTVDRGNLGPVNPNNLAYVIYTSGSTGRPKGVMISQASICNRLCWMQEQYQIGTQDAVLQKTSPSFDVSVWEFFWPLMTGAKLVLAQSDRKSDPNYLIGIINSHHITVTHFVPSVFSVFLNTSKVESCSSLRHVICSGEALSPHLKTQFFEKFSRCRLHNLYGPTEASIDVSYYECQRESACQTIPIGKPIANTQLYILDHYNNPVPIGVQGELHIGGAGLARGYLNYPDLTAQKFVNNPFDTQTKLYRTGDLARYLNDGNIEFLGRMDDQVKIRGLRIELGEIESVIRGDPGIHDVVVVAREDSEQEKKLAAYIITKPDFIMNDLKQRLSQQLPDYMVPQHFIVLKQFPITPNGKLDHKALPVPNLIPRVENHYVAPRSTIEIKLAALWASLLKLPAEHISIHDNFFLLGGHSLSAVQLIAKIRNELSINLPMQSIFSHPTIFQLADFIVGWQEETRTCRYNEVDKFDQDIFLEAAIGAKYPFSLKESISNIFLTGATGFLGAFLLKNLLVSYKNTTVYCLVRESDLAKATQKIISNLKKYHVWHDDFAQRIIPVLGDLSQQLLGMSKNDFNFFAEQVDVIFHNGAMVNHVYAYQQHKSTNVLGTHEILRFASQIRTKPVHYISTLGVYSGHSNPNQFLREDDEIAFPPIEGYSQSKWVSEKIILLARARGMPINIYRPGRITGHSKTGIGHNDDAIARIIKGCIQLKMMPHTTMKIDFTPVDYVSDAIITIAQQSDWLNRSFNIINPDFISLDYIGHHIRSLGFSLQNVDYSTWHRALLEGLSKNSPNVLHAYLPVLNESAMNHHFIHNIQCDNTIRALGERQSTAIFETRQLLQAYFSYLMKSNYIQQEQVEIMP